jgi:hypothetical protein
MKRTVAMLAFAGVVVGAASLGVAQAADTGVAPVKGGTGKGCSTSPPRLLGAGRAPLTPLRLDLTGVGRKPQTLSEVETFATRTKAVGGKTRSATEIRKISAVVRSRALSNGQITLSSKITVSFPGTKTAPAGKGGSFTISGHANALSGGFLGGSAGNDRFPVEPVGVGATWRVVICDDVDEVPAKEIRTYRVRSLSTDRAVLSFRDVVSMDPRHRDAGTQKIGDQVIRTRLDKLHGSAKGTVRIQLSNGVANRTTQVTRVVFTFHLESSNIPTTPITTKLVDTRVDKPGV